MNKDFLTKLTKNGLYFEDEIYNVFSEPEPDILTYIIKIISSIFLFLDYLHLKIFIPTKENGKWEKSKLKVYKIKIDNIKIRLFKIYVKIQNYSILKVPNKSKWRMGKNNILYE